MILIIIGLILIATAFKEVIKLKMYQCLGMKWRLRDTEEHTHDDHIKMLQEGSHLQTKGEETISACILIFDIQPSEW